MRAILIDVEAREVKEIQINGSLESIYKNLKCDTITSVYKRGNGDFLYVDDNGLLINNPIGAFNIIEYGQILSGNGIFIGCTESGENASAKSSVNDIANRVNFLPTQLLKHVPTKHQFIPMDDDEMSHYLKTGELPIHKKPTNSN